MKVTTASVTCLLHTLPTTVVLVPGSPMEDPWANAWGEPAKQAQGVQSTWSNPAQPSSPGLNVEVDIAMPSWATGAGIQWSEPSPEQTSLWASNAPFKEWPTSTYEDLPLGKRSSDLRPDSGRSPSPDTETSNSMLESPKQIVLLKTPMEESIQEDVPSTTPNTLPPSPDPFGTFETGLDAEERNLDPWAHSMESPDIPTQEEQVTWVPSWGASDSEIDAPAVTKAPDEWEMAKQQKERQDLHVPPHVLASILDDFQTLSRDLWPHIPEVSAEETAKNDGRSGIDSVEGLMATANRIVPQDMTLPQYAQFSKTFTAKYCGESLRLTRHVPVTRLSPFNLYLTSKGSTAWETSVKARVEAVNDDLLPPGWRVVEKDKESLPIVDTQKKASGGLLSFFGRRTSMVPPPNNLQRSGSESSVRAPPLIPPIIPSNSPTPVSPISTVASADSVKSLPAPSSTSALVASSSSLSSNLSTSSDPAPTPTTTVQPTPDTFESSQTPSAVSRFLGRFSRSKPGVSSPRNSLALSTDDLEFLSDIVPSANDEVDEASQLRDLSVMISSSPLPAALPPPLAPPPRPPPRVTSNMLPTTTARLPPPNIPTMLPKPAIANFPTPSIDSDDLFSVFNSPQPSNLSHQPVNTSSNLPLPPSPITALPPPPTPTSLKLSPHTTGFSSSSYSTGRSSPFEFNVSRTQTPTPLRRTPVAIMSSGSASSSSSSFHVPLPPPPILPPPPVSKPTLSKLTSPPSRSSVQETSDFIEFSSLPSATSVSTAFSDESLFPESSITKESNDWDDFDDFVSSQIRDPSPPRPPAKPTSFNQPAIKNKHAQALPPQPPMKSPSPLQKARAADHHRTLSLVTEAAARPGVWPAPRSPLPNALPPPPGSSQPIARSNVRASWAQPQQGNGPSTSPFPFSILPPPGFSAVRNSTMTPSPPPPLRRASPAAQPSNGYSHPLPSVQPKSLISSPTSSGGLSAQDLSFFEGL
ncbi:hypothetical protein H0H81_007039 [Sphagnurus paluster]|uniref:Uncharacterized protein n=1 Tax=Sphagnurus paluster TaxID=117069 RepID=A0A9P7FXK1_9AGAR|nr:hypothetical protein H0H81_007039 [Sphagnurus paluster]